MKRIFFCMLFLGTVNASTAQPNIRVEKTGVTTAFILEKNDYPGTLTVFFDLKDAYNSSMPSGRYKFEVRGSTRQLMTLRNKDEDYGAGYSYSWFSFRGRLDPEVDSTFVYRMPVSVLKPVRVLETVYILDRYKIEEDQKRPRIGFLFPAERGDTVYAMRRGVVVGVDHPEKKTSAGHEVSFTTEALNIQVEQPDGTTGWYIALDPDNVFVQPGDELLPGDPLGLAGSYDGENYRIAVQIYYYLSKLDKSGNYEFRRYMPRFATTEGDLVPRHAQVYTPLMNDALRTTELSKKEVEKLNKGPKK